jgi:hypothetical protein
MFFEITNNVKEILQSGGAEKKKTISKKNLSDEDIESSSSDEEKEINIKTILEKILSGEKSIEGIEYVNRDDILKSQEFKDLEPKDRLIVTNKLPAYVSKNKKNIYDFEPTDDVIENAAYFVCINCKNFKPINEGTLIYSQNINSRKTFLDLNLCKNNKYDNILPRDRNYTCPNEKCPSHKDISVKEQVTKRYRNNLSLVHTCCACQKSWTS